jgi:hypothetical protein
MILSIAIVGIGVLSTPRMARACSIATPPIFQTDPSLQPAEVDDPHAVSIKLVDIKRGRAGDDNPRTQSSSCDDLGHLVVSIDEFDDDVGYLFEVVAGEAPRFFGDVPETPIHARTDGSVAFTRGDRKIAEQETLDFTITVTPVNRAGEMGPTSEPLHITAPPRTLPACSTTEANLPLGRGVMVGLGALCLLALRHRRR